MSESNKEEEPTVKDESEMEVEDKRAERKEEKENNTKTCIFITIIIILAVVSIGLLIALIIVAVKNSDDSDSSSSPLEYTELYVSNEKKGKGDCISIDRACDSLSKAYKKINAEGDYKIYVISDTLNAETEEIVIENSVTITKPSSSSLSNQETSTNINVCDIDKDGDKKSLFSMSYKSRSLNINYLSFLLEKDTLKPSKPVISMDGGSLSLLSCSFGRVDEAGDILSSSVIDITNGNCAISSCSFNNIQREEGSGGVISAILNAGSTLEISSTVLNGCILNKGNGGAIYTVSEYGSSVVLKNVEFIACQSKEGDGGAMYAEVKDGAKMVVGENEGEECSFKSCKAGTEETLMKGGGLYIKVNNSKNVLINNVIFGKEEGELNEASNGKGIFLEADEWNENTITAMFPVISREGKDNRRILEGMKVKEEGNSEIIDLYTAAYANDEKDSIFSLTVKANQIGETNKIKVQWETDKNIDEIKVEIIRGDKIFYSYISSDDAVIRFRRSITMEGIYGKERVRVTGRKGSYTDTQSIDMNVTASKYVVAPLVATMPVTIFSLKMKEYTSDYSIPTLIWLERYLTYDWTSLPDNFFLIPTFKDGEIDNKDHYNAHERVGEYVKELHEINPESKFELYICDLHIYGSLFIVYANNLSSLFNIHMLSDGYGTREPLKKIFSEKKPDETYANLKEKWITLRDSVIKNRDYNENLEGYIERWDLREYCVAIAGVENNIDWTIEKKVEDIVGTTNVEWFKEHDNIYQKIKEESLEQYNDALDDKDLSIVKRLFHISDSLFGKAEEMNKKVLCIVGTSPSTEVNLEYLLKVTVKLYDEEYMVFYKGHPSYPTTANTTKMQMFNNLKIIDVDSSIPFEIIYFLNLNMMVSGYEGSTFNTLPSRIYLSLYDRRKEYVNKVQDEDLKYRRSFNTFISRVTKNDTDKYKDLMRGSNSMLVQFRDNNKIVVYDPDDDTVKYYEENEGNFNEISGL